MGSGTAQWHKSVLCVTLLILLIFVDLVFLTTFILMWKRRHLQPLRFRGPILGIFITLGATMGFTWTFIKLLNQHNSSFAPKSFLCPSWSWIAWISYPFVVVPVSLRAYRLWRVFRATEDRYNELSSEDAYNNPDYLINSVSNGQAPAAAGASHPMTAANTFSFGTPIQTANVVNSTPNNILYSTPFDSSNNSLSGEGGGYTRIPGRQSDSPQTKLLHSGSNGSSSAIEGTMASAMIGSPTQGMSGAFTSTSTAPLLLSSHAKKSQFVENQVMTEERMLKIFAVVMLCVVFVKSLSQLIGWESELGFGCNGSMVAVVPLCFNIIQATLGAYLLVIFRHIKDDYGAAREVTLISGMWVAATVIEVLALMIASSSLPHKWGDMNPRTYGVVHGICHLCRAMWIMLVSGIWPLNQSFTTQFVSLWSDYSSLSSLDTLLYDMVCLNYFHAFLLNEQMSADYLSCWMEIELYNELALSLVKVELEEEGLTLADADKRPRYFSQLRVHASRIFDRYIAPGCEKELKLVTEVTRQKLVADINAGLTNHHTFDRVQGEAYAVMNSSFPRFKSSLYHRKCLADLDRDEQLRSVLEKSGMIDTVSQMDV